MPEEKSEKKLYSAMKKALSQSKELNHDPFLRERMITGFGASMGVSKEYVRDNIAITPDVVAGFAINGVYQADIAKGNIVAFDIDGLSFIASYQAGNFTFKLNLKGKLYEIRTVLDLAKIVEPKEDEVEAHEG